MLKSFRLAIKFLERECFKGEWLIIFTVLLIAITALTSLNFYTDRLMRGLDQQSAKFLGGNLVVTSPTPISKAWIEQAKILKLRHSEVLSYLSMVGANKELQLVNLQAVSKPYPLFGSISAYPNAKHVWVDPRLLALLHLKKGDVVTIGAARFLVEKELTNEMEIINTGWIIAPRLIMRLEDVASTQTVIPGSRVDYRLLLVGSEESLSKFRAWITPQLAANQRLLDVNNQRFVLQDTVFRTKQFIQLALLACLLMSSVAIALCVRQYLRQHYAAVALWRCLGAKARQIGLHFFWQLLVVALLAGLLGSLFGYTAQTLFVDIFKSLLFFPLPPADFSSVWLGVFSSIIMLFAFASPLIGILPNTPPLYLWRNEVIAEDKKNIYLISSLIILLGFLYWITDYSLLTLFFLNAVLVSIGFLYIMCFILLKIVRKSLSITKGAIRHGLRQLVSHPENTSLQFTGFTLIFMAIFLLSFVRTDLIQKWQATLPPKTPNFFMFNIAPGDISAIQQYFADQHVSLPQIYPMVRGRLIALNNKPILSVIPVAAREHNALHRELNLSWMWELPSDNKIIAGENWSKKDFGKALVSVEKNLSADLGLHLGDELSFQIGDKKVTAKIINFRSLDWESFHPNFFMIFPPGLLTGFPVTYITSIHLEPSQAGKINQLVLQFPSITIIDVSAMLEQVQVLIQKITLAMEYLFLFAAVLAFFIFIISLRANSDLRHAANQLLGVLGARKSYIIKASLIEFSMLGILSIGMALLLAKIITYLLVNHILHL